jgi:HD-GYP domain-containing protein (c-di-GMP phosphodiesterase class II)
MSVSEGDKKDLSAAAMLRHLSDADIFTAATSGRRWSAVDENAIVRAHSECEARLLASIPELGKVVDIIKSHRENFDGSGSPGGLAAERIPLASRILRVANEYDLMIQPQASVASMSHEETMRFLSQRSGKQFDPKVIEIMSQLEPLEIPESAIFVTQEPTSVETDVFEPAFVDAVL